MSVETYLGELLERSLWQSMWPSMERRLWESTPGCGRLEFRIGVSPYRLRRNSDHQGSREGHDFTGCGKTPVRTALGRTRVLLVPLGH